MAERNTNSDNWIHLTRKQQNTNSNFDSGHNLTIIDQATLESLMDSILELSTDDKQTETSKNENGRSTEYSRISTPIVKSISSNSSEKNETVDTAMSESELLWYWSSRPEVNNMYSCSKWITGQYPDMTTAAAASGAATDLCDQVSSGGASCASNSQPLQKQGDSQWFYSVLPRLLLTHACTFIIGAATMLFLLKRYVQLTAGPDEKMM